jgi:hypothetical protein
VKGAFLLASMSTWTSCTLPITKTTSNEDGNKGEQHPLLQLVQIVAFSDLIAIITPF